VEAASFLITRLFHLGLIGHQEFLRLRAVVTLCKPASGVISVAKNGQIIPATLYLSANLIGEIIGAIQKAAPRLRLPTHQNILSAVKRVLNRARDRAFKQGVVEAYAYRLARHSRAEAREEKQQRARAFAWAREHLGDGISRSLLEEELDL
jgi:hypothetical protein